MSELNGAKEALKQATESGRPAWLRDGIVTLLLFLLLLQWLGPLPALAGMDAKVLVEPAAMALAVVLLLDYLRFPGWLGWPLKTVICLTWVGYMFSRHTMPDALWFETYARTLLVDVSLAWSRHYAEVSAETRLLMFVLGWALMISVIHSLMLLRQHGLWFVLATLVYLLGLQLATDVSTLREMAYATAIGLGLLLLLNLPRVERKFAVPRKSSGWPFRWLALGSMLIAICVGSGWWGANAARGEFKPIDWSDLARWSDRYADKLAKSANAQGDSSDVAFALSGYGTDDRRLGTPLVADDKVAFTAMANRLAYWRGESKSYYDGSGWLSGEKGSVSAVPVAEDTSTQPTADKPDAEVERGGATGADVRSASSWPLVQEVMLSSHSSSGGMLFVGGAIERMDVMLGRTGTMIPANRLTVEQATGKYLVAAWQDPVQYYRAVVDLRSQARLLGMSGWEDAGSGVVGSDATDAGKTDADVAEGVAEAEDAAAAGEAVETGGAVAANGAITLSESEKAANLQLPSELPGRVSDLAHRVAGAGKSPYEQAALLESYLKTNYTYSLSGSRVPEAGKDFVDDFLFRQLAGYCDHFSSAMVVMLRTLGIPARWVKGYAPGEVSAVAGDDTGGEAQTADGLMSSSKPLHITVRNRDAHSWAEAWIDGVGWVAFEPTPGFAQAAGGDASVAAAQPAAAERGDALEQRLPAGAQALARAASGAMAAAAAAAAEAAASAARAGAAAWRWASAAALVLALLAWAAWRWRDELALQWALRGYRPPGRRRSGSFGEALVDDDAREGAIADAAVGSRATHGGAAPAHADSFAAIADVDVDRRTSLGDTAPASAGAIGAALARGTDARPLASRNAASATVAAEAARRMATARAAAAPLLRVCERLWPRLRRRLGGQPPQQTLREFAAAQAALTPSQRQALAAFAQLYEAARYGNVLGRRISRRELAVLWRTILKPGIAAGPRADPRADSRTDSRLDSRPDSRIGAQANSQADF